MTMYLPALRCTGAALLMAIAASGPWPAAHAEGYPARPVQLVVPLPPGGAVDIVGRLIGKPLGDGLGQPLVVENKAGAGTLVGAAFVANAPADGYTLLIAAQLRTHQHGGARAARAAGPPRCAGPQPGGGDRRGQAHAHCRS